MDPTLSPLDRYLRHRRFYEVGFWVVFLLEEATANSITSIMDIQRAGVSFALWGPPVWEFSSVLALLALVPAVLWMERRFPFRFAFWRRSLLAHALATVPFSLLHVGAMVLMRKLAYAALGGHYDFGDTAHLTPLVKMHTLGSTFVPPGFHAGGLRYHGMAPLVSHLKELDLIEAVAYTQVECFAAGVLFARTEGIVPAPEANHAVKGAIEEALRCKREGRAETILFNLCGHGHFDMTAYQKYFAGELTDETYDEQELAMALAGLPSVPAA